ncbi:hypothetical protein Esti_006013 [Eimeria stiedai]
MAPKKGARAANGGKKRAKKDPDAPKRGTPAYIFFMKEKREEICKKNPSVKSATEIAALVGDEWKKLTPSQKAPYEKKAEADKQRYQREIAAYKKKKAGQATRVLQQQLWRQQLQHDLSVLRLRCLVSCAPEQHRSAWKAEHPMARSSRGDTWQQTRHLGFIQDENEG